MRFNAVFMSCKVNMFSTSGIFSQFRSGALPLLKRSWIATCIMNSEAHLQSCNSVFGRSVRISQKKTSICPFSARHLCVKSEAFDEEIDNLVKDKVYYEFSDRLFRLPDHPHNVLVVQPFYRDPAKRNLKTTPELQLEESVALINSLPGWRVVGTELVAMINFKKKDMFGRKSLERLNQILKDRREISAVFVSVNIFRVGQLIELETYFEVPCYDRYTIVIQIFRNHATTKEAKLQISMAEIPYLRQCIKGLPKGFSDRLGSAELIGGTGMTLVESRRSLLSYREKKIKEALNRLRSHRDRLRRATSSMRFPVVAVVGYTNAGKTSLIRALTGEEKLQPRDQLFATLDVTKHAGILPCNLKVLFVDTVGFISDIPSSLIQSFNATLEDALHSDLIIHVWDASNPDSAFQRDHVHETLKSLELSGKLLENTIHVGNKVDKLRDTDRLEMMKTEPNMMFVSTKTGFGMPELLIAVQHSVLKATERFRMVMRVRTGGEEFNWLCKEVAVENITADEKNPDYCFVHVVLTPGHLAIFKHLFI